MPDDLRDPKPEKIRCDACPVMCFIADGKSGACDRYANHAGELVRLDPLTVIQSGAKAVAFLDQGDNAQDWDGDVIQGIFSYCGVKVKIDTDRHIGDERAVVRAGGEAIGHVMTSEYGSKMLSLGGVEHLTGGSKKEGRVTCDALLRLCNREPVEVTIDGGVTMVVEAGKAPIINGTPEKLMRVGCGSATIGMFAKQWYGHVDEVVVVDDHITGVLTEHEAGKGLDMTPSGIRVNGRRSTPGRYFQVADPGTGWGGTDVEDPLTILRDADPKRAWPGLRLLMISTTGEQWAYFTLDDELVPQPAEITPELLVVADRIAENCEPSLCSVLFMGGAGGSLRAGVTENPVRLTRSVKESLTHVSCGGAEASVWPGGGITVMVDVMDMPTNSFGYVPTPALVAPIEFTLRREDYGTLGGHMEHIQPVRDVVTDDVRRVAQQLLQPDPNARENYGWSKDET